MEMEITKTENALITLWNVMCCYHSFRPTVPISDFEHYWLLLRRKWELADKNHPDTWIHHYEVDPLWFLVENKWTL